MRSRYACLLLGMLAASCSEDASSNGPAATGNLVTCNAQDARGGMCVEYIDPLNDTMRLSIVAQCREVNGEIVERCPARYLLGTCERAQDTTRAWTLSRATRTHFYEHPDAATPESTAAVARRCSAPAVWTPAPASGGPQ